MCDFFQGERQGRGGSHDRPPRDLYERRGLNEPQFTSWGLRRLQGIQPLNLLDAAALLRAVHCGLFRPIINFQQPKIRPKYQGVTP
jgi:hypothetical protein